MICTNCNNILIRQTGVQELKYMCLSCGSLYSATNQDSLLYSEEGNAKFTLTKNGKSIYFYPSNQKVYKKCTKCSHPIVAWENDKELNKIYGCQCGYSWKESIYT